MLTILDEFYEKGRTKGFKMAASISCSCSVKQIYPRRTLPFVNAKKRFQGGIINGSYSNSCIVRYPECIRNCCLCEAKLPSQLIVLFRSRLYAQADDSFIRILHGSSSIKTTYHVSSSISTIAFYPNSSQTDDPSPL